MIPLLASIGFVVSVTSFIAGFRMVKRTGLRAERMLHRVNGYVTITLYIVVAAFAIASGTTPFYIFAWLVGLGLHFLKLLIIKKGLAVRYGGYFGALLLIVWLVVIFTHLPK
jgi:hypothetical protein